MLRRRPSRQPPARPLATRDLPRERGRERRGRAGSTASNATVTSSPADDLHAARRGHRARRVGAPPVRLSPRSSRRSRRGPHHLRGGCQRVRPLRVDRPRSAPRGRLLSRPPRRRSLPRAGAGVSARLRPAPDGRGPDVSGDRQARRSGGHPNRPELLPRPRDSERSARRSSGARRRPDRGAAALVATRTRASAAFRSARRSATR